MLCALLLAPAALAASAAPTEILVQACPDRPAFAAERVPDAQLGRMRAGVRLPNGLSVSIGIDIQTRVDGVLVLHTVYTSDGPNAGIRVFTDGTDAPSIAPGATVVTTESSGGVPIVTVDRSAAGTTISPGQSLPATTVNLVNGGPQTWLNGAGEAPVPVVRDGPAVAAAPGAIRLETGTAGAMVILVTPTLEIRQLLGSATGIVVANTSNDRAIDTVSSINVDLQGLSPQLLAGAFMAQRLAVETTLARGPGL